MPYYLAPFVGAGTLPDPCRVDGATAVIDLRPNPSVTSGWALAACPAPPANSITLGDAFTATSTRQTTRAVEDRLGLARDVLAGLTLRRIIEDLLLAHADAAARWRPLRAMRDSVYRIYLDVLVSELAVPAGGATVSDGFNRANADALGPSWTELVGDIDVSGNQALVTVSGSCAARYEVNLDTDAHYAQMAVTALGGTTHGLRLRHGTTGNQDYYATSWQNFDKLWEIGKNVGGTWTVLRTLKDAQPATPFTIRGEVNGSTIKVLLGTAEKTTVTDTSLVGQVRCGMGFYNAANATVDDWSAGDLATTTVVGSQTAAVWNVRSAAGQPRTALWDIRTAAGQTRAAVWNVAAVVARARQAVWNVGGPFVATTPPSKTDLAYLDRRSLLTAAQRTSYLAEYGRYRHAFTGTVATVWHDGAQVYSGSDEIAWRDAIVARLP